MDDLAADLSAEHVAYHNGSPWPEPGTKTANEQERATALEGTTHGMTLPNREDVVVGSPGCQRCEVVPIPMTGSGTLHLRLPHTYSLGKVLNFLTRSQWQHSERQGTISVEVEANGLAPLLSPILDRLSPTERRDTRAMFQPGGQLLDVSDYFEIAALPDFVTKVRSAWLLDILRDQRIHCEFQPILWCATGDDLAPSTDGDHASAVFGYECLMRGTANGETVAPGPMLEMARAADLIFQLDLAARRAALLAAAAHQIQQKVFINFTPSAIYNPWTCLDSTVRMVDELGFQRHQIVFEIIESERLPEVSHLKRIVEFYRENGFGVALDDIGSGYSSLNLLLELRPDYVKIDMGLIRGVHTDAGRALVARKLIETAHELNLKTVAEGVETEDEMAWVQAHGSDFAQGYFIARPDRSPPLRNVLPSMMRLD